MTLIKPSKGGSSGGGDVTINATGNAKPEHVLFPYTFSNAEGVDKAGTCKFDCDTSEGNASKYNLEYGYSSFSKGVRLDGAIYPILEINSAQGSNYVPLNSLSLGDPASVNAAPAGTVCPQLNMDQEEMTALFGDLTPDKVLKGEVFGSASGLGQTGALEPLDTSDANAIAREICLDKTAYVNDEKVTGTGLIYRNKNTIDNKLVSYKQIYLLNLDRTANSFAMVCGWVNYVLDGVNKQIRFSGTLDPDANVTYGVSATSCRLQAINGGENTLRLVLHFPLTGDGFGSATDFDVHYYYRVF